MVVKLFWTSTTGSRQVREQQKFLDYILSGQSIDYELIDLSDPANTEQRKFCLDKGLRNSDGVICLPQVFTDQEPCGTFEDFESALDSERLPVFLGLMSEEEWEAKRKGSKEQSPNDKMDDDEEIKAQTLLACESITEMVDHILSLVDQVEIEVEDSSSKAVQEDVTQPCKLDVDHESTAAGDVKTPAHISESEVCVDEKDSSQKVDKQKHKKARKWDNKAKTDDSEVKTVRDELDDSGIKYSKDLTDEAKLDHDVIPKSATDEITLVEKSNKGEGEDLKADLNVTKLDEIMPKTESSKSKERKRRRNWNEVGNEDKVDGIVTDKSNVSSEKTKHKETYLSKDDPASVKAMETKSEEKTDSSADKKLHKDKSAIVDSTKKEGKIGVNGNVNQISTELPTDDPKLEKCRDAKLYDKKDDKTSDVLKKNKPRRRWADEPIDIKDNAKTTSNIGNSSEQAAKKLPTSPKKEKDSKITVSNDISKSPDKATPKSNLKKDDKLNKDKNATTATRVSTRPHRKWGNDDKDKEEKNDLSLTQEAKKKNLNAEKTSKVSSEQMVKGDESKTKDIYGSQTKPKKLKDSEFTQNANVSPSYTKKEVSKKSVDNIVLGKNDDTLQEKTNWKYSIQGDPESKLNSGSTRKPRQWTSNGKKEVSGEKSPIKDFESKTNAERKSKLEGDTKYVNDRSEKSARNENDIDTAKTKTPDISKASRSKFTKGNSDNLVNKAEKVDDTNDNSLTETAVYKSKSVKEESIKPIDKSEKRSPEHKKDNGDMSTEAELQNKRISGLPTSKISPKNANVRKLTEVKDTKPIISKNKVQTRAGRRNWAEESTPTATKQFSNSGRKDTVENKEKSTKMESTDVPKRTRRW